MKKTVSPIALNALKRALTNIYWLKDDLRRFLSFTLSNPNILAKLNWDEYKRNIIGQLIDIFAQNQQEFQDDLLNLMAEIIKFNDFSHLYGVDKKVNRAKIAEDSVEALRTVAEQHFELLEERKQQLLRRESSAMARMKTQEVNIKLNDIYEQYKELVTSTDKQQRGYKLEELLRDLFELFDLDPRASFKVFGEQIDGSFTFDNTDYILEAKWQSNPIGGSDLDSFDGKISRRLDNTLGLFVSISGFQDSAVSLHSQKRSLMILVDGFDLVAVLEGRIDLKSLLIRKRKHAAQSGNIYLKFSDIL